MLKGLFGIFLVTAIIIVCIVLMNKLTGDKGEKKIIFKFLKKGLIFGT